MSETRIIPRVYPLKKDRILYDPKDYDYYEEPAVRRWARACVQVLDNPQETPYTYSEILPEVDQRFQLNLTDKQARLGIRYAKLNFNLKKAIVLAPGGKGIALSSSPKNISLDRKRRVNIRIQQVIVDLYNLLDPLVQNAVPANEQQALLGEYKAWTELTVELAHKLG